jgi:RNA recognition motif-containing protein
MNYATTEDELRDLFAQYGEVKRVTIVTDKMTGRPRGFAFVEMSSDDQASAAIAGLNNSQFAGRQLRIDAAQERPRGGGGGGGGGRGDYGGGGGGGGRGDYGGGGRGGDRGDYGR